MAMSSPSRRLLTAAALAALAAVAVKGTARRRAAIGRVAADLRSPVLLVPFAVANERVLGVVRSVGARADTPAVAGIEVSERIAPGSGGAPDARVLLYEPPGRARPSGALLWIHGGGLVMGRPEQANTWCSSVAAELGILVVSIDYRLAPEHPFPAGLTDCVTALRWLHDQAADLGVDPERIAVGGDSAGGGLAAALCQRTRDEGGPPICFQLLNYPMLDDRTGDDPGGRGEFVWTPASNRFGWSAYLGPAASAAEPPRHAAPARTADLADLPPAWIGVGDLDLFWAEDVDYAERLLAAGVACELHVEPGMFHGADQIVLKAPRMKAYRDRMVSALADALT